jgi:hypothetical protein
MYMGFGHDHGNAIHEVSRYGTKNSRSRAKNENFTVFDLEGLTIYRIHLRFGYGYGFGF